MVNNGIQAALCDGRKLNVDPDKICDVTALPFPDETFYLVVFDPVDIAENRYIIWSATGTDGKILCPGYSLTLTLPALWRMSFLIMF